jgi:hypothetical protein
MRPLVKEKNASLSATFTPGISFRARPVYPKIAGEIATGAERCM